MVGKPGLIDVGRVQQTVTRAVQFDDGSGSDTVAIQPGGAGVENGEIGLGGIGPSAVCDLLRGTERCGREALLHPTAVNRIEDAGCLALDTAARHHLLLADPPLRMLAKGRFERFLKRQRSGRRLRPEYRGQAD